MTLNSKGMTLVLFFQIAAVIICAFLSAEYFNKINEYDELIKEKQRLVFRRKLLSCLRSQEEYKSKGIQELPPACDFLEGIEI